MSESLFPYVESPLVNYLVLSNLELATLKYSWQIFKFDFLEN